MGDIHIYFDSICRITVEEYNKRLFGLSDKQKMDFYNHMCENDSVFQIGKHFGELATFPTEGSKGKDIYIDNLDFEVSIKYWRSWVDKYIYKSIWKNSLIKEIQWLYREIEKGNKGKKIIICSWGTVFKWHDILQLGSKPGKNLRVNEDKMKLLPFLKYGETVKDIETRTNYKEGTLTQNNKDAVINWKLIGNKTDSLNMVMYW